MLRESPAICPHELRLMRRNGTARRGFRRRRSPSSASSALWACWCPRLWRGRRRPCRLCAGAGRDRRRRRRGLDDPQRAQLGRLHAGAALRLRGAEAAVPEADGAGRDARLLLPDRAAGRLRRRRDQDPRAPPRQPLGAQRHQAVHHLGQERRCRDRLCGDRSRRREARASAPLSCRPTPRATASRGSSTSSASAPPIRRSSSSRTWN